MSKLLLLDMDGTLIDSNGIWKDVDIRFLERCGMEYSKAYYEGVAHTIFPLAAKFTKEFCSLEESCEEIMQEWMELAKGLYSTVSIKPGVREFLQQCRTEGKRMALVTSSVPEHCHTAVVDGGAHTAHGAVTLQVDKAGGSGLFDKFGVQLVVAGDKGHVHQRAVLRHHGTLKHLRIIQEIVQQGGLLFVELLHLLQPTEVLLDPLQHQLHHLDGVAGRGVEHRAVVGVGQIVKHGGGDVHRLADEVLADDHYGDTGGSHILLSTCI